MTLPRYEILEAKDGTFYWHLKAGNGEIVAQSESYPSREHAERGVEDAKRSAFDAVAE